MAVVRGYGAVFNRIVRTAEVAAFVVTKDTFSLAGRSVGFCIDHAAHRRHAATNNRSMSVWNDAWGLAFECEVEDEGVVDLVRRGACIEASCHYHPISHRDGSFAGEPVKFFDRATVSEISLVPRGGCPDTAVWVADMPEELLTDHQRFSARMWRMGKFQNSRRQAGHCAVNLQAPRNAVPAGLPPRNRHVPPCVVALLDDAGFQAFWAENARLRSLMMRNGA